jgi:hypothetical protein
LALQFEKYEDRFRKLSQKNQDFFIKQYLASTRSFTSAINSFYAYVLLIIVTFFAALIVADKVMDALSTLVFIFIIMGVILVANIGLNSGYEKDLDILLKTLEERERKYKKSNRETRSNKG